MFSQMNQGRGKKNPWNAGAGRGDGNKKLLESAQERFDNAKKRYNTQQYSKEESSEEEDNAENGSLLENLMQKYTLRGGGDLGKTGQFLKNCFQSGADICLICISSMKRTDPVS